MKNQFINALKHNVRKTQLILEKPYQYLEDQNASAPFPNSNIAPNVYQTWVNRYFGKTHFNEILQFRKLNPDLNFYLYDNQMIESYMEEFWGHHPIFKI